MIDNKLLEKCRVYTSTEEIVANAYLKNMGLYYE